MLRDSKKLACSTAPTERRPCGNNMAIPIAPQNLTARKDSIAHLILSHPFMLLMVKLRPSDGKVTHAA